jgi:hypothetical protein
MPLQPARHQAWQTMDVLLVSPSGPDSFLDLRHLLDVVGARAAHPPPGPLIAASLPGRRDPPVPRAGFDRTRLRLSRPAVARGAGRRGATMKRLACLAVLLILSAPVARAQSAPPQSAPQADPRPVASQPSAPPTLDAVFVRLYNFDFPSAHALLDRYSAEHPEDPLAWSVRAAAYLFTELDRTHVLEIDFFLADDNIVDQRKLPADPAARAKLQAAVEEARARARARLAADPEDRNALLAMSMAANVVADYTGLVERRQWRGARLARESAACANKLLALRPPVYDAYHTTGVLEYLVGSLPFYVRWFVHYDQIQGDKRKGIENLKLVARYGRFYGPFARVLLAVISIREGKLEDARQLLSGLAAEFPENPLLRRELARVTERLARGGTTRRNQP